MKRSVQLLSVLCLVCSCASAADTDSDGFVPLFNGRDLTGWVRTNTPQETWTVRDGLLICSGKPIGELRTRKMYQNFILELEWRHIVPGGNAGLFLWADDLPARGVPFHRGIEVQILEHAYGNTRSYTTHGDIFPIHGARMTPDNGRGGSRSFPTEHRARPAPEWNHYRLTCRDGRVELAVNGKQVNSGHSASPARGYLCLESEGGIVHYRNIRIKELPESPVAAAETAIADRGFHSLYSGLSLVGWRTDRELPADSRSAAGWKVADWTLKHQGETSQLNSPPVREFSACLLDVRRTDDEGDITVLLQQGNRQVQLARMSADGEVPLRSQQWVRITAGWQDGAFRVAVNEQNLPVDSTLRENTTTSLVLQATGAIEVANLFARWNTATGASGSSQSKVY